jgi:hypothetical protein
MRYKVFTVAGEWSPTGRDVRLLDDDGAVNVGDNPPYVIPANFIPSHKLYVSMTSFDLLVIATEDSPYFNYDFLQSIDSYHGPIAILNNIRVLANSSDFDEFEEYIFDVDGSIKLAALDKVGIEVKYI